MYIKFSNYNPPLKKPPGFFNLWRFIENEKLLLRVSPIFCFLIDVAVCAEVDLDEAHVG